LSSHLRPDAALVGIEYVDTETWVGVYLPLVSVRATYVGEANDDGDNVDDAAIEKINENNERIELKKKKKVSK
jgi:hypothetical protein